MVTPKKRIRNKPPDAIAAATKIKFNIFVVLNRGAKNLIVQYLSIRKIVRFKEIIVGNTDDNIKDLSTLWFSFFSSIGSVIF